MSTLKDQLRWYYFTRALGTAMVVYGVAFDHSGERGTIITAGAGFFALDQVAGQKKAPA